jgi:hypothetical protein
MPDQTKPPPTATAATITIAPAATDLRVRKGMDIP